MLHYCYLKGLSLQHWTYVGVKWNGFNLFFKGFYCETFAGRPYATTAVQNYIFPHPYLEIGLCLCQLCPQLSPETRLELATCFYLR